jgi:predicted nucleic acid-binding protein
LFQSRATLNPCNTNRSRDGQLSFWDALIVQAAIEGHANTLYCEDMQHGQTLDSLRVVNPFS